MKRREAPAAVPNRWPFVTVRVADVSWVAKVPGLPGSRLRLVSDFRDAVNDGNAAHRAAVEAQDAAGVIKGVEAVEAAHGWLLLSTWADPVMELDAAADWRAEKFTGIDAKAQAGLAALVEISEAFGLTWHHVVTVCGELLRLASSGDEPSQADVTEVRFFSTPPSDSAT